MVIREQAHLRTEWRRYSKADSVRANADQGQTAHIVPDGHKVPPLDQLSESLRLHIAGRCSNPKGVREAERNHGRCGVVRPFALYYEPKQ
jgi:hypothetical protein